ncbi:MULTISPECIES: sulfite exporter TauE/SafE family protein [unclassified Sphaerospermopsis]|uniref:sulfite exporter TauE/SafE family protein n=1 Tax=unclassified Sphaerospermopsis TaxID=2646443 RepID=UPI001680409D|nr:MULTISPECIES: sulfite exporter TauE/SafE family protein [unclassified Sphaerospermopsis]MBD2134750.1 sulfite exporter TauE/SafE family protein [Sphaerospermopsis sp. FACHB-1094]MBD2148175.1 sulfite exporter TauE/SafE family protein [Sphaerospermopsis sp. FACHB-1194]
MTPIELLILAFAGIVAGILAGFLGIGGGTVLVPLLISLGNESIQAVATSSLSIVITASAGSIQNWRMGYLDINNVLSMALPALITAQIGVLLANLFPEYLLLFTFGLLLISNIYLVDLRKKIVARKKIEEEGNQAQEVVEENNENNETNVHKIQEFWHRIITGGTGGLLAGLFGVGGGIIMVPLQIVLLNENIKKAIQTSLGVIVITAISATAGHAYSGNVLWLTGAILGFGGLLGVQFSTRFLPKLPDKVVSLAFRSLLAILSIYIFWKAWQSY